MAAEEPPCQSPSRSKASSIFKDISNFKTPKRPTQIPKFTSPSTQFFTASKQTPRTSSSFRRRPSLAPPSATNSKTVRKLRTLEVEQLQSSRKAQIKKERSLKSLSKSITVWLNFLFQSPGSCGVDLSIVGGNGDRIEVSEKGKRDSFPGIGVRVDAAWRNPKRQRDSTWRAVVAEDAENVVGFSNSKYSNLESSLKYVCSFEDLKQRMSVYLSLGSCKEVFDVMTQLVKNIDEGRLKMKAHCPLVTDVGLKQKATRILMCYNPIWLRIGLYIIFGGDSLLSDGDVSSEEEIAFSKMFIEKQFFSHAGLAKAYAYNKMVEGLYRPGYYETLGNVILKRFLLLVLILDRAKCQSSLSLKYGIDGVDGGSPLLFTVKSRIKSSSQVIQEFLSSEIMLGEGNVLAHLVIVGYKVSYQQNPLVEYNFQVTDLFVDFQDGVRLCRATQLLLNDSSILMKIIVPSDTRKKSLANCSIVLQYLKQAGMPLCDDEGMMIEGEDVSNGDKELTLSLLWNMFVHLQLPLLMKKTMLVEEICKIRELNVDLLNTTNSTPLEMLFSWIQAICQNYNCKIDNLSSLVDGKAIWCLLDYYFRKELCCSYSSKNSCRSSSEESIVLATDYADAVHNFLLSQKLTTLLGNFPEVLQISDILEYNGPCNDRSVVILLVFLASQLIVRKNMDQLNFHKLLGCDCQNPVRKYTSAEQCFVSPEVVQIEDETHGQSTEDAAKKFKAIQAWWRDMTEKNYPSVAKPAATIVQQVLTDNDNIKVRRESAAKVIQSHFRQAIERRNSQRMLLVQHSAATKIQSEFRMSRCLKAYNQYKVLLVKHNAATKIQSHFRCWIVRRRFQIQKEAILKIQSDFRMSRCLRAYNQLKVLHIQNFATTKIQSHFRCWILRRRYQDQREAILKIQSHFRMSRCLKAYNQRKVLLVKHSAATKIQSHFRCWILRRRYQDQREAILKIQSHFRMSRCLKAYNQRKVLLVRYSAATKIQSHFRCWMLKRRFQIQKEAILKIQSGFRMSRCLKDYNQSKVLLVQHFAATKIQSHFRRWLRRRFQNQREATLKIQSYFRMSRCLKAYQQYKILTMSATIIQSCVRGWICRREVCRRTHLIVLIQRLCRGWLIRRDFMSQKKAVVKIQAAVRGLRCLKVFHRQRQAAVDIQRFVRAQKTTKKLLGASSLHAGIPIDTNFQVFGSCCQHSELNLTFSSVLKLQRWWRGALSLKRRTRSALTIQSHFRGWIARRKATRERHCIVLIQSYWKGYQARKESRGQLLDLRLRVKESARNVDDNMRIINRLIAALSELLSKKSVSSILHTCATLDMATRYSQKCCEKLVEARAINTLLKLIQSVSRSIPDQEVLKHALSTLRNLARYPHLVEVLIDCHGSVETILREMIRNKEEVYFIASDLLKKICASRKGIEAVRKSPALLKRLHNLVEELTRKAHNEKRNARGPNSREYTERRLREASEILKVVVM
ncbi:hypothetical protein UlMin_011308 [Ulmus minor]